jgi:predicted nucleic acid-binding protein
MIICLDTGIIGILTSPSDRQEVIDCRNWLYALTARSAYFVSSDICDYEVRRSLILESFKHNKEQSIKDLNDLQQIVDFFPVTTEAMRLAAHLWANSRSQGQATADPKNLDADVIIAAQCQIIQQENPGQSLIIATTNVNHLSRFLDAQEWQNINF